MSTTIDLIYMLIINGIQAEKLKKALNKRDFHFTVVDSSGGFLQEPTTCLLIGLEQERRETLLDMIEKHCSPFRQYIPTHMNVPADYTQIPMIEAQMGGAVMFSMNVERFIQI